MLRNTLTRLCKEKKGPYQIVKDFPINPKALSLRELYGEFNLNTIEWTDGILSTVMRQTCADEKPDQKWLLFDAPVDHLWIESMNSVMDDNKVLTLINGEHISMPEQKSVEPLFDKYVAKALEFRCKNCKGLVPMGELNAITSLCYLLDSLATAENGVDPGDSENYEHMFELWFRSARSVVPFCMIWSVCAGVDKAGRKMDTFIREMEGQFPAKVYGEAGIHLCHTLWQTPSPYLASIVTSERSDGSTGKATIDLVQSS